MMHKKLQKRGDYYWIELSDKEMKEHNLQENQEVLCKIIPK
jgi:hypothetical protein